MFYRDLEECGKPQFLFCLKTDITKQELENSFYAKDDVSSEEQNKREMKKDGEEIFFISIDDLRDMKIDISKECIITVCNKEYRMDVSAIGSICLCIKHLK